MLLFRFVKIKIMIKNNIFSILVALIILFLSLVNAQTFEKVSLNKIPNFDKFVHFAMYFGLMSVIIFENRISLRNIRRLLFVSLIPFSYGILLEFLQAFFTSTRSGSLYDALADFAGVYVAVLIGFYLLRKLRSDAY
jgi:VanZ family protein